MAILINGNGNPAIYPDQDADWFASIFGGQTAITGVGSQFAAEIQDANTIALADGVIITKEGRRIQLDANQSDIFEIPTGAQGTTNYYIIGYCLTTNDDSSQTAETFVQLMENATDTIDEDTFRGGADKVYVSVYRVTQTGFNLETPELLLPKVESLTQLNSDLTANNKKYQADYHNGKYGFMINNQFYELGGGGMYVEDLDREPIWVPDATSYTMPNEDSIFVGQIDGANSQPVYMSVNGRSVGYVGANGMRIYIPANATIAFSYGFAAVRAAFYHLKKLE